MFHKFNKDISSIVLPDKFTCPFCYAPHILSQMASNRVQQYIQSRKDWTVELQEGKMFGVMVVQNENCEIGFISAFSGQIQGQNIHDYFVPPVYDLLKDDDFFKSGEAEISDINKTIERLEQNPVFMDMENLQRVVSQKLTDAKDQNRLAKMVRDEKRKITTDEVVLNGLIKESQFQKAEYKRLQLSLNQKLDEEKQKCDLIQNQIDELKAKRKEMSAALQRKIFEHFVFKNALGNEKSVLEIWNGEMPPAGAGECAAPRLLQYAYNSHLKPIAMAEFWWGKSTKEHIRRQGSFYPACKHKCEPILNFMLQGLDVEENRYLQPSGLYSHIEIVYEDDYLVVVNKPTDMLSVPGPVPQPSVWKWATERYGGVFSAHRLDMATSGLLIIAKSLDVCRNLQRQFENREIHKKYVAVLDGIVEKDSGEISLPIRPDFDERPFQIVDFENGKPSVTTYEVLDRKNGRTRIVFYPQTGRTHQLRIHAAHPQGLNCPIVGDTLYGTQSDRLYLHAEEITFSHPINGKRVHLVSKAAF